ncbi:maleylacetate reductase [Kribbella lupini]|uniref:Maleylacetate reductase n=1 Tax=Kribbella lupini TaxID=291602 RepID=A0ABN2BLU2_9ACTN
MPESFVHTGFPSRIVFGAGTLDQVAAEVESLQISKALVIATGSARDAADVVELGLEDRFAGRIDEVRQHVPVERADAARAKAREISADGIVALGGGSAIGLAKAIALTTGLPIVAVPTTYAGSEMTPVWGQTADGAKTTGTDLAVLPRTVVYDPVLSRGLPLGITAASVANALAHCVEATWTVKADPITELTAVEGARALHDGLLAVVEDPHDLDARGNLLYGACLAGSALATAGTGLHHKLCHLLGGTYGLPHAETHAAVLPQVTHLNAPAVPRAKSRLESAIQAENLATGLYDFFSTTGVPTSLRALGLSEQQAKEAAQQFAAGNPANVVPVDEKTLTELLLAAWSGERPSLQGVTR